ncbi:unnamed protein product [Arctia plantaginis]|uniref:Flavin-containing monooxygenase n=1 Tax=Arctia plantaginis TaxID=874455 RepID=A0A8S1AR89_ARCPL|nr:unnamed protein product [Arctia plantaginis]
MAYRTCVTIICLLNLVLEVVDVVTQPNPTSRVCIIGAGYSGLSTARYMKEYGLNYTVFEASRYIGGTWRFDPHVGTDENGLPLFTSQYKGLRTNTPRHTMEMFAFPFPDDTPSYPTGECFYKYLQSFVKHFHLMKDIQLESFVTKVQWSGDGWNVTFMKSDTKENVTEFCSFVVVASGEYSKPFIPEVEKMNDFKGKILHSHDYKDPEDYRGQRVMLVGAGASGLDLAVQLSNTTSKLVHSHHLTYNQPKFPGTYVKKPDLQYFTPNGAVFEDNSFEEFDVVIFCTGYHYSHPYLDQLTSGITATTAYVLPLYQHIVNIKRPSMAFVGLPKKVVNKVLEIQAQYVAALAADKFKLPPQAEMLRIWLDHVQTLKKRNYITDVNVVQDMGKYFEDLHKEAFIPFVPPVITTIRDFNQQNRLDDLLNYRDYDYNIISDTEFERKYNPREPVCNVVI